ncbi:cytochrome P450 [Gigaspora margarita]|nr:cytochrome P450 [Gigaspora margarita]
MWEIYKGPIRTIWLARNDLFEKVFSPSTNSAFLIRAVSNSGLEEFNTTKIGMTFNSDLKEWSYNRKFMSKAIMSPNFIKQVVEGTQDIFEVMEKCWQNLFENLGNDQIFNIHKWMLLATSESIILLTTHKRAYSIIDYYNKLLPTKKFDIPIGALEESENYIASIRTYIRAMEFFFTTPKIIRILPGVRQYAQRLIKNRDLLYEYLKIIIQERRKEIEKTLDKDFLTSDLLTSFLTANTSLDISNVSDETHVEHMSDEQICGNLIEVFAAGTDSVANSITFIIYYLAHYPKVKECVVKELETVFGRDPNYRFSSDDLSKLRYCEAVIKEVSRIFPSAPTTFRTSTKPVEIGGHHFPANLQFFIYIEGANNHPQHWTDPNTFNPDRFLDGSNKVINTFGGGLRMCPGRNLSIIEILSFMVMLYRKYDIELVNMNAPIRYNFNIIRQCVKMEARIVPRKFE